MVVKNVDNFCGSGDSGTSWYFTKKLNDLNDHERPQTTSNDLNPSETTTKMI